MSHAIAWGFLAVMIPLTARIIFVHHTKFMPAKREFDAAHACGDIAGMERALAKERAAMKVSFNPIWFFHRNDKP